MTNDKLLKIKDIAEILGIHLQTVALWRSKGKLPKPDVHTSRRFVRWKEKTIQDWIDDGCELKKNLEKSEKGVDKL